MQSFLMEKDTKMYSELVEIISHKIIRTIFQPIVSLYDGSVLGYEALSRGPVGSVFENPSLLFEWASKFQMLWEVDFLCRLKALENASKNQMDTLLFLNVDPKVINDPHFREGFTKEFLQTYKLPCHQVVFEITERSCVEDTKAFRLIINHYKQQGYKIAIDDTGSGYSGLNLLTDIHPQYMKLDMELVRNIDSDPLKYALVKALYDFASVSNIRIIAEGIETKEELSTLIDIGIHYGQGYLLSKGEEQLTGIPIAMSKYIMKKISDKGERIAGTQFFSTIGALAERIVSVSPQATVQEAMSLFETNPELYGLPVVQQGKVVGILPKEMMYSKLATRFGYDLFLLRPVSLILDANPLVVEENFTLDTVSKLAMTRTEQKLYDYIIVCKQNEYYGIVTVKKLLEHITETKIQFAKHLNPLTGLPGNLLIQQQLQQIINREETPIILYLDIDCFKAYNDSYGFSRGDKVIMFVAQTMKNVRETYYEYPIFNGHIGGDDFVMTLPRDIVEEVVSEILSKFEKEKDKFYSDGHIKQGFIKTKNRKGIEEEFPLVSLSIAGIDCEKNQYGSIYEVTEVASRLKKVCKSKSGNAFVLV